MKPDPKYNAERFLAAYDAAQDFFRASDEQMADALEHHKRNPICKGIRVMVAGLMAEAGEDGRTVRYADIGVVLGIRSHTQVARHIRDFRFERAGAGVA